ncbi:auxilin-like clathrin-binding protein required for normal clathrin function [Didymella sp. IMI 355093]|nr:auxilin-like clathrin-binding protein required for normal clathrin function [Didymella sp. IMI 355093]
MDDLNGLDWSQPAKQPAATPAAFPPFRQSPTPQLSGRSTPLSGLSGQQSGGSQQPKPFKAPSKPATPANDSFASLISSKSAKPAGSGLSLQERQKQLQEEKLRQEAERRKQYDASFGGADSHFWNNVGSGKSTPEPSTVGAIPPPGSNNPFSKQTLSQTINRPFAGLDTTSKRPVQSPPPDDDLLAAFNKAAPVDKSSHFPPPSNGSGRSTPAFSATASRGHTPLPQPSNVNAFADDDDDMFGLKQMAQKSASPAPPPPVSNDDDDILGLLGKPVEEFKREEPKPAVEEPQPEAPQERSTSPMNAHDRAVAELVDMGFAADQSAIALATTDSGLDVQAAVGWILNQAHAKAKQRSQEPSRDSSRRRPDEFEERPRRGNSRPSAREGRGNEPVPAWARADDARSRSGQRRQDGQQQEKDVAQVASEIGSSLFKSANSLWKQGRKQVQKAVADFQQDGGDPNMPKWMRDAQAAEAAPRTSRPQRNDASATDEAMMLEAGGRPSKPARQSQRSDELPVRQRREQEMPRNGLPDRMSSQSPAQRQPTPSYDKKPAARLTRQDVEEQSAQAYVSPARRKKATPQPQPEVDLFSPEPTPAAPKARQPVPTQSNNPFLQTSSTPKSRTPARTPSPPRPKAPPRRIPPASSSALSTSARDRQKGSEAFKRGDYSAAHIAYTSALGPLPDTHPVTIIVLCNRAVTNIKVGDPKAAIADADAALAIIGVSKGDGEKIASGGAEGDKDMKEFYGKALMRKAEALEHMEKWADAHKVWKLAVQDGVGGAVSISGRNRCEKAAAGGNNDSTPTPVKRPPVRKPAPKPSAMSDLGGSAPDSEAVKRLKLANAAAEKADDEKFALADQVDAKLIAWKGGKTDNLRALLGSLDNVLWPEAGWKKVGMGDLVMPNKVKINYMKAIAKVHPDKIPQSATTEQKMISASVFATLNEAWDKFKADNNL